MIKKLFSVFILLVFTVGLALGSRPPQPVQAMSWPTSTPEAQGIDSNDLIGMLDWIEAEQLNVHSILVMRHDRLVMEVYFPPNQPDDTHLQASVSKSITSALMGIAVSEGKIQSIDQPFLDYFRDLPIANPDKKENIHIHDLLNMTSGLVEDVYSLSKSEDQLQYCINLPVATEPGTAFEYTNCNALLLSAILQRVTGETTAAYAQEKLFDPLGIKDAYWAADSTGLTLGYNGLILTPREMMKFGMLYNQHGMWEGQQVVPADWVAATLTMNDLGYGYLWWQGLDGIGAAGAHGQRIFVFPQQDIIIVITGGFPEEWYGDVLATTPLFAIRSDEALPESQASVVLAERIFAIEHPKAQSVPPLPAMAAQVNGKTIQLNENELGWKSARLEFIDKYAYLHIETAAGVMVKKFVIGLDEIYRGTLQKAVTTQAVPEPAQRWGPNPYEFAFIIGTPLDGTAWMKGAWIADNTFVLTVRDTRDFDRDILTFHFSPPGVSIDWYSTIEAKTVATFAGVMK